MKYEQMGRFTITGKLIRDHPEYVAQIFAKIGCVPVRAEVTEHDSVEYEAISKLFDALDDGELVPEYTFWFEWEGLAITEVSAERLDDADDKRDKNKSAQGWT